LNQDAKDERIDQDYGKNQDSWDWRMDQDQDMNQDAKDERTDQDRNSCPLKGFPIFVGVQLVSLRLTMTELFVGEPYRFFTDHSKSDVSQKGFRAQRRIYFFTFFRIWSFRNRKMRNYFLLSSPNKEDF